jgi:hypothetical protein
MLLQFQVYDTTTGAPRTIGLTSAKGGNTTGDIAENPCCVLCPAQMSVCILICVSDVYIFVFISYELQELVIQLRARKLMNIM